MLVTSQKNQPTDEQTGLIVVGRHGHGVVDVLVGSSSAGILHWSDVPVLVLPVREEQQPICLP